MATAAQIDAVERLVRESVANIDRMAPDALRAVMPALRDARDELQRDLTSWIANVDDGANRFTAYERTRAIRALEGALERVEDLEPAMAQALAIGRQATGPLAVENLGAEITRLSSIFGDGLVTMPQIDTAAVIARGDRLLWKRHVRSAARYAGDIGNDIRHQFAVGLAKHETFEQLTTRLRRLGGGRGVGLAGDAAGEIADGLVIRYRHWANRLVRTEMMHGYNVQHAEAIEAVNAARPDDEDQYLRRWDAAADNVTCPICKGLDRTLATLDGEFKGGIKNPPAHPHCRCVVLAWLARWGGFKGETPPLGPVPKAPPRPPRAESPPQAPPLTPTEFQAFKAEHGERLTDAERKAAMAYASDGGYKAVNSALRKRETPTKATQAVIDALDSQIEKSAAPRDMQLHRGVTGERVKARLAKLRPGDTYTERAFVSTAADPEAQLGGLSLVIRVPRGARMAPIPSDLPGETEVLLPRGSRFRVAKNERVGASADYLGKQVITVDLEPPRATKKAKKQLEPEPTPKPAPVHVPVPHQTEHGTPADAPVAWEPKKNPKRVAAAQKAAAASAERLREIHSGIASNLSPELQVVWEKEGHKFIREESKRVRGVKDRMTAASRLSEAFTEKYGSGEQTAFGNEGDRFFKRAEIEAKHAESWADAQEAKYYAAMEREMRENGEITDHGKLTTRGRAARTAHVDWETPQVMGDEDPPF